MDFYRAELTKEDIRCKMLTRLKRQKEEERLKKSDLVTKTLINTEVFKKAKTIISYIAFGGEVETKQIMTYAHKLGKKVGVPFCGVSRNMQVCRWEPGICLSRGIYGTWEPTIKEGISTRDIDLVIVPGLAFDILGNRLGRGKGFYDRFLRRVPLRVATVGLAFDFQILPRVPVTPNDFRIDQVIFA